MHGRVSARFGPRKSFYSVRCELQVAERQRTSAAAVAVLGEVIDGAAAVAAAAARVDGPRAERALRGEVALLFAIEACRVLETGCRLKAQHDVPHDKEVCDEKHVALQKKDSHCENTAHAHPAFSAMQLREVWSAEPHR
jgi:hypothetical protein